MANENSIDVYHALMALEEKVTGVAPDPENVTTDVALALADIFRTDVPMAQETAIVNAIDTITANYGGGGGGTVDVTIALCAVDEEVTTPTSSIDTVYYFDGTDDVTLTTTTTTYDREGVVLPAVTASVPCGANVYVTLTGDYNANFYEGITAEDEDVYGRASSFCATMEEYGAVVVVFEESQNI